MQELKNKNRKASKKSHRRCRRGKENANIRLFSILLVAWQKTHVTSMMPTITEDAWPAQLLGTLCILLVGALSLSEGIFLKDTHNQVPEQFNYQFDATSRLFFEAVHRISGHSLSFRSSSGTLKLFVGKLKHSDCSLKLFALNRRLTGKPAQCTIIRALKNQKTREILANLGFKKLTIPIIFWYSTASDGTQYSRSLSWSQQYSSTCIEHTDDAKVVTTPRFLGVKLKLPFVWSTH